MVHSIQLQQRNVHQEDIKIPDNYQYKEKNSQPPNTTTYNIYRGEYTALDYGEIMYRYYILHLWKIK